MLKYIAFFGLQNDLEDGLNQTYKKIYKHYFVLEEKLTNTLWNVLFIITVICISVILVLLAYLILLTYYDNLALIVMNKIENSMSQYSEDELVSILININLVVWPIIILWLIYIFRIN